MSVSARYLVWIEFGLVVCGDWHSSVFCRKKKHSLSSPKVEEERSEGPAFLP